MKLAIYKRKLFNNIPQFMLLPYKLLRILYWYIKNDCSLPAPHFIKQAVLQRNSPENSIWVETGTYLGDTTKFLSSNFPYVHTIEPSDFYIKIAKSLIKDSRKITFHKGTSEECFEDICQNLTGDVSFWLDGHFSGGNTYKNDLDTPVKYELNILTKYINKFEKVSIFIDDIRCSFNLDKDYPSLNYYVNWALKNNFKWTIEHDIFILIKNKN